MSLYALRKAVVTWLLLTGIFLVGAMVLAALDPFGTGSAGINAIMLVLAAVFGTLLAGWIFAEQAEEAKDNEVKLLKRTMGLLILSWVIAAIILGFSAAITSVSTEASNAAESVAMLNTMWLGYAVFTVVSFISSLATYLRCYEAAEAEVHDIVGRRETG